MITKPAQIWTTEELRPFGLCVKANSKRTDINSIASALLEEWISKHRVVVLRGFAPLLGDELPEFCQRFGELLEWDFGVVNNLHVKANANNYLYTNRAVPFHWDGAFIGRIPHYIFFHCDLAPSEGSGGETLFCDTVSLLKRAPREEQKKWEQIEITYSTEKIVHYGGTFTSQVITTHPVNGEKVIRFAEPVNDLNPVELFIKGIPEESKEVFLKDMNSRLNDERVCYSHNWMTGDIVIADNHTLLHGRRAFSKDARRHIRRINIL